jgi:hypothetical protein
MMETRDHRKIIAQMPTIPPTNHHSALSPHKMTHIFCSIYFRKKTIAGPEAKSLE